MTKTGETRDWILFLMVFFGLIFYEILSGTSDHAIDRWDIGATMMFTTLSALVYFLVFEAEIWRHDRLQSLTIKSDDNQK